ncbi:MAG: SDR family oxidoreductase [Alphaproteobacteria bacterium]|nr:SDR family oxidoreductase [Alphaproteobacteria bacterium]
MARFDGRIALVTGGGGGIGRAIAHALAGDGAAVGLVDTRADGAAKVAAELETLGRRAVGVAGDVTDPVSIRAAAAAVEKALGPVDILVNNAGIARIGPLLEVPEKDWHDSFAVNVDGVFHASRAVMPGMVARRRGCVVNLASWLGKRGAANYGAYAATKFAVVGFTQSLAFEMAPHGIRVNCVCPGLIVDTEMRRVIDDESGRRGLPQAKDRAPGIPLGRVGYPDEVARVVAFLCSDEASYVTGAAYDITGGSWMS